MKKAKSSNALNEVHELIRRGRYVLAAQAASKLQKAGDLSEADTRKSLRIQLQAYNRLQWLLEGRTVAEKLSAYERFYNEELLELALFYVLCGNNKQARKYFKLGLQADGGDVLLLSELALTYEHEGEQGKAENIFSKIIEKYSRAKTLDDVALRSFGRLAALRTLRNGEINLLQKEYNNNLESEKGTRIAFILAKAYRKNRMNKEEVNWLVTANKRALLEEDKRGNKWNYSQVQQRTDQIKSVLNTKQPGWLSNIKARPEKFIFILGMPRSGTTLVEQIIGAHSSVGNAGESRAFNTALLKAKLSRDLFDKNSDASFLSMMPRLTKADFEKIADEYVSYQNFFTEQPIVTDKELSNIDWVGLLACLFPNAHFVYVERHPLDNCVSLMQQHFKNAPYSNSPESCIKEYYEYYKKAEHWRTIYPSRFLWIKYEELISDPAKIKWLITNVGLEWESGIQEFYMRSNSVRTPSVGQVREGISNKAVGKWKKYEELIYSALPVYEECRRDNI